jgi:hypothetical protein
MSFRFQQTHRWKQTKQRSAAQTGGGGGLLMVRGRLAGMRSARGKFLIKNMSNTAAEQLSPEQQEQQEVELQRQLQAWATNRVKLWAKLQRDDYDFGSWAKGASKNCLTAGATYEYARESQKLRCLLALMNPKRPREAWEIMRPGSID